RMFGCDIPTAFGFAATPVSVSPPGGCAPAADTSATSAHPNAASTRVPLLILISVSLLTRRQPHAGVIGPLIRAGRARTGTLPDRSGDGPDRGSAVAETFPGLKDRRRLRTTGAFSSLSVRLQAGDGLVVQVFHQSRR